MKKVKTIGSLKAALMYALVVMNLFVWMPSAKAQTQDGTAEHPFLIQNKEQLIAFRNCVNGAQKYYFDTDNGTLTITRPAHYIEIIATNSSIHYKLTTDIIFNSGDVAGCDGVQGDFEAWEPIGKSGNAFYAQFDGGYHTISGLFINKPNANNVGFFGMLTQGSSVKNLGVVNAYISGKGSVGGIVGDLVASTVSHCFVDATIVAKERYVGGIAGQASVSVGTTTAIDTCYAAGSISCNSDHIGGICGGAQGTIITSCYSSAIINYTAANQVGGVLGVNTGSSVVENCYYDRQMCGAATSFGTGKLTNEMVQSYWQELGSSYLYEYAGSNDQYYPSLNGFNQNNYQVRLSTLPVILNGEQNMSDVRENFKVGGKNDGFSWVSSDNSVAEVKIVGGNYVVEVKKQGWFQLTGSYGTNTHTVAMYTSFGAVKGTEENPFTIDNQADLLLFRNGINSGTPFTYKHYTIPARGANTYFLQTANITLPDVNWSGDNCISKSVGTAFAGVYDGGNFEVQGLKVTSGSYVGFFGYIQYGTVKNLGIRVKQFSPSSNYGGPLCAVIRGGTIDSCYVAPENASVVLKCYSYFGGLVGLAAQDTVRILNSHNECNIVSYYNTPSTTTSTSTHVGGILGASEAYTVPYLLISHCYNTGDMEGRFSGGTGGIVGIIYLKSGVDPLGVVEYCYNTGNITNKWKVPTGSDAFTAGIVGYHTYNSSKNYITHCYNTGDITAYCFAAGIMGYGNATFAYYCYNTGKITILDSNQPRIVGAYGISYVGRNRYCLNLGEVSVGRYGAAMGIGSYATHCMNAGAVSAGPLGGAYAVNSSASYSGCNLNVAKSSAQFSYRGYGGYSYYDSQMAAMAATEYYAGAATSKKTSEMLGTSLQSALGTDYWVYTEGMYPRIKGLENEDVSLVASSPVCLSGSQTVNGVSSNFTVNGCGNSVEWTKEGDLVTNIAACSGNTQTVTVADAPVAGMTTLTATRNGVSKKVQLCYDVTPPTGSLNVANLADLKTLRDGVNSGAPFDYNGTVVPAGALRTTFKQTAPDIDLASETNWEPIGTPESPFRGVYDGDEHTISKLTQSGMTNAGLFGCTKYSKIMDLTMNAVNISNIYGAAGSFASNTYYDTLVNCSANGSVVGHQLGTSMLSTSHIGGLVGRALVSYLYKCSNFCSVTGGNRVFAGGIVGVANDDDLSQNKIKECFNAGSITGDYFVGGLCGYRSRIYDSYNYGAVTGTAGAIYIGGLSARNAHIENSFNTGTVTAQAGAAGQDMYVGGLVGLNENDAKYQISQSYNTGIVEANNRKYVGGIAGYTYGRVTQCYNANAVNSTGEYVGSLIGYCNGTSATYSYNYYDNAFSQVGGVSGADVSGKAEAKTTAELTGGTLPTGYTAAQWTVADGFYPRIANLDAKDASYASAAKLQLPMGEVAKSVSLNAVLTTGGCADEVTWGLESGNSIHFNNTDCTDTVVSRGVVYVQASKNDVVYKTVKLNAGVSVNSPLVIKSKAELVKFRNLVNEGTTFYYNMSDSTYSATDGGDYFAVTNQGEDLYFKLLCDVDLSDAEWTPIGTSAHPFAGHFNGGNHTVTGMKLTTNGSNRGFIGYLKKGSIDSLAVQKSKISGTGSNCGFVCGVNNTGIITHCSSSSDTIITTSGSSYGGICGLNMGTLKDCTSSNDTISSTGTPRLGGICGAGRSGSIDDCIVENLSIHTTNASNCYRTGGVVGSVYKNRVVNCHTRNSKIEAAANCTGGICGADSLSHIMYCTTTNTTIISSKDYVGGIIGYMYSQNSNDNPTNLTYCIVGCETNEGVVHSENGLYVGGIGGYVEYYLYSGLFGCKNGNPVKGKKFVGGIIGYTRSVVDSCYNLAKVEAGADGYCGGIVGYAYDGCSYVRRCINLGEVSSTSGNRIGGIVGYNIAGNVSLCCNAGRVSGNDYVGGICGGSGAWESNNYNVGQVYGGSFVGGICGAQYTSAYSNGMENNLNVAHVQGNSITGAVSGYCSDAVPSTKNFYDKQFSYSVGINGVDVAGKAEGKLTSELIGSSLSSIWGSTYYYSYKQDFNTYSSPGQYFNTWEYTEGHYPQLKLLHAKAWDADASEVTSTPITIPDTLTSWTLPSEEPHPTVTGGGAGSVVWSLEEASPALEIVGTSFNIKKAGVVEVAAAKNDSIYKRVRLLIGISEDSPALIPDYNELCNFRNGINSGNKFYYDATAKKFYESQDAYFSYIEVSPGGEGMFFRLENNIDMALYQGSWTPIGNEAKPFKGNFHGNDKTIVGMVVDTAGIDYHGLFGYSNGSIKNLTVAEPNVKGSKYTAALCGFNKGTILHCGVEGGTVTGSSDYTGGICGKSANGSISECYNAAAISGKVYVGGIAGSIAGGVTQQCFNLGKVSNSGGRTGGIAGYNSSYMNDCYNTGIISGKDSVGGINGFHEAANFQRVYNAGYVEGTGAMVSGLVNAIAASQYPVNAACDMRMAPSFGVVNGIDPNSQAKQTDQMTGTNMQATLGNDYWTYSDSLYPRLTAFADANASYASATPLYFQGAQTVLDLTSPFIAYNKNGVTWSLLVPSSILNLDETNAPGSGKVVVANCGEVSMLVGKGSAPMVTRQIDLIVQNVSAGELNDTTCGNSYVWALNGRTYDYSGDYIEPVEIGPGCNQITTLHLVVPEPLAFNMQSGDVVCYGNNDGYITPNVTGCFGTYTYEWTKEGDASFSSTASALTNLEPGKYYITVTDATKTNCKLTDSVVIAEPTELILSDDFADSHCYGDNDGELSFKIEGGIAPYSITWTTPSAGSATQSLAGTYSMIALPDGTYDFTVKDANNCSKTMNILVDDYDTVHLITAYGIEKPYDGVEVDPNQFKLKIGSMTELTLPAGVDYTLGNGDILNVTVSQTTPLVNAGVTANNLTGITIMRGTEDVTCRYNIVRNNDFVRINKRNVTITSKSDSKAWDGTPLVNRDTTLTGDGFADGEGVDITWDPEHSSQTNAGASYNQFTYAVTSATNEDNYTISPVFGMLTVTAEGTLIVSGVTVTKTYDGLPLQADYTVSGLKPGHHVEVSYAVDGIGVARPTITNVDTVVYDLLVGVFFDETNENAASQYDSIARNKGTITINKLPITLTSNTKTKTYDGTELYDHDVTISGDVNNVFSSKIENLRASALTPVIDYTPTPVTNAITYGVLSGYVADNYTITKNEGALSITKKTAYYKGEGSNEPYTGEEQCLTGITPSNLLSGHTLSGVTYSVCGTNAGSYVGTFTGTPVVMNGSADVTDNYELTPVPDTLTIQGSTAEIVITSASMTDEYYEGFAKTKQEYTVTYGGTNIAAVEGSDGKKFCLPTNDTIVITPTSDGVTGMLNVLATALTNDFDYAFAPAAHASNYQTPTTNKGTLNLLPRDVTLRSKSWTQNYTGSAIRKDEVSILGMGFVGTEGINAPTWDYMDAHPCIDVKVDGENNVIGYSNVFDYTLKSNTIATNYNITVEYGKITINKLTLTVTADDKSRTYGENNPTLTYTMSGFVNASENETVLRAAGKLTGTPNPTTTATSTSPVGSNYEITMDLNDLAATNYNFHAVNGRLAITKRQIHINPRPVTVEYDGLVHTWEESSAPHYDILDPNELRVGDTITNVVITGNARMVGQNAGAISVGAVTIMNGDENVSENYNMEGGSTYLEITKKALKITVQNGTHEYDGTTHGQDAIAEPKYVVDHTDTLAVTDSIYHIELTGGGIYTTGSPYEIAVDTISLRITHRDLDAAYNMASNYNITVVKGEVEITQNTTPIVITSASANLPYNGAVQKKNEYTVTEGGVDVPAIDGSNGLKFRLSTNDVITITPTFAGITNVSQNTTSDTLNIFLYALDSISQYSAVSTVFGAVKIAPVELTVKADHKSRPFGTANPEFTATYAGFVGSENENTVLTGEPEFTCTATNTSPIGDYDIVITQGTLAANNDNYTFNFVNGTLTVTSSPIVVTAIDSNWVYDGTAHRYAGFVVSVNGAEHTVTPAHVGDAASSYTLENGDVMTVNFSNSVFNYNPEPTANHIASIDFTRGSVNVNSDYPDVTTHDGQLTITPRPITVKANSHDFVYNGTVQSDHGFTVISTYSPALIGSDTLSAVVEGEIQFPSQAPVTNEVRSHSFTYGLSSNYSVSYENGTLTMHLEGATTLAITAASNTWTYDGETHSDATCTLVINGDDAHPITISNGQYTFGNGDVMTVNVTGSVTNVSDGEVNNVPAVVSIVHGSENVAGNYDYATRYTNGTLKVNPIASVTVNITGRTDEVTYNGSERSVSGYDLACENSLFDMTSVTGPATEPAASGTNAGSYNMNIDVNDFSSSDANFTTVEFILASDGQLVINKKAATITAVDENLTYTGETQNAQNTVTREGFVNTTDANSVEVSVGGSITYPSQSPVTKTVTITTGNSNYDITPVNGQLTMTYGEQTALEITAASGTWTYDGNAHDTTAMIVKVGTGSAVDVPNSNTYTIPNSNGDVVTVVCNGTITHAAQSPVPNRIQSYTILNNGNDVSAKYSVTLRDGALTVNQKSVTITANSNSFVYDGNAHTDPGCTHTALMGSDVLTATATGSVTYPGTPGTNTVNFYAVTTGQQSDYSFTTATGTLTVTWPDAADRTALTITPSSASKTYDGTPLTSDSYTLEYDGTTYTVGADGFHTFANGDKLYVDIQGSNSHVANNSTNLNRVNGTPTVMNGTVDVTSAYAITATATGTLTINPREVTITSANGAHDYDGNPFKKEEVTKVGFIGTEGSAVVCNNFREETNPGTYENTFDIASGLTSDYTAQKVYGMLTINAPEAVTVTITGNSGTFDYDGTEHTVHGYTWISTNPLYNASSFRYKTTAPVTDSVATAMVAGTHTMALSADDFENTSTTFTTVNFVVVPGTLTINKLTTPIVITAESDSKVYDGTALTKNSVTYTDGVLLTGDELTATVVGSITNVGQYPNQISTYKVMHGTTDVTNCYTFGNLIDGVLTVTKRNASLTSATASKTYDGTALTNSTVTPDGFVTGQGATCTVTGTQTVVGSSANTFTYTLNSGTLADNYNITTTNGTLTVNQMTGVKVKITGHTDSHVYDGAEHSVSGYDVAYENNTDDLYTAADFTFNGTASAAGTHAGTHNMGLNASQFVNNNDNFGVTFEIVSDGAMTITPVTGNVAVTVVGNNLTRVYDGNAYTVEGYTVTTDNALYTEDCFTCSRTARATRTDAGTTNMGLVEGDFTNTSADFTGTVTFTVTDGYVTITQDPTAMTVTCPTVTAREYNGTMFKAAAATSNVAAATIKYSVDNTNWTDTIPGLLHVGTRTVYVKATHTNYADATCNYTLEVTPAPLTVTAATRNFIYCGSAHSIDTVTTPYTVSGLVAADAAATHTATVAGTITFPSEGSIASTVSDLVLTGASNDDYDITYVPGVLTVSYNPTTLTLTTYGHTWTYDGLAHDTLQYSVTIGSTTANELTSEYTLPNGHDVLRVYFNNASVTNVNEGEVSNSISSYSIYNGVRDVTGNYVVNTTIGKLKISPKAATVTANSNSWVYDGLAHSDNGYAVDGLVAPNTLVATVEGSQTAVGHSANTVTDYHLTNGDINNYTITPVAGVLTVTASASNIVLAITSSDGEWTYDGTAHAANGYTLTIDGGTPISVTGSDYTLPNLDVLTVTLNTTVTDYTTGTPNAIADVKVMRGSDDVTDVYYDATSRTAGTLVINKRDVTVKVTGHTLTTTYDGESHVVRGYDLACEDALFNVGTVAYSGADSVKSIYVCDNPMSLAQTNFSSSDANFNASFTIESDGRLTINKRTATVTATDEANTYDGNVHNANATLFTLDNVVAADVDKISIEVSGSIQYPTQSPVTKHITAVNFTPASLADNYNITPVDGQLTMTYGERIALDIYSLSDTVTYDGASHHKDGMSVAVAGGTPVVSSSNTYSIPGRNGDQITITLGTTVTDATTGTPNTIASYTILNGTENVADKYNVLLHPGTLVVNKKEVTVTSATHEWPYDGFAHSDHGFTVEGLVGTDGIMVQVEGTVLTPDTIDNEIVSITMAPGNANNYTFVKVKGKLSVRTLTDAERIALTITPNSATKMYDGTDLTADGFTMLFNGNTYTVDANGVYDQFGNHDRLFVDIQGANKHVSTNTTNRNTVNSWTVTHDGVDVSSNYNVTSNTGDLTITPRSITMTSADDSKVYDATALTNDGVTVTGDGFVTGEGATYNVTGTQTIAGSSNNTFTYELTAATQADDYTVATPVYGTLEVTKRPITITANDYTVMYDGEQHTYAENTGDILTVEAATTGRGLISGHVIADTTMTGARTDAGTTPIVIASAIIKDADDHVVTDNYDITFVAGTLTVEPRTGVVVTIKGHNAEYDYDGTYHLLQGYDVESNYTPYTESDFTFTGTALVNEIGTPDHVSVFPMGLQAGQFSNINPNYTGVVFNVTDGKLIIYPELKATVEVTPISCNAANGTNNDGKAKVTVTGGKPDLGRYTYQLNTNAAAFEDADSTFANLTAGDYTVTITDSLNGSVVVTFTLEEPSELTATLTVPTGSLCPNQGTYPVSVAADGGNGGFTFEWSGSSSFSSTTDEATNVNQAGTSDCGTTYTVTVTATDNMGCKKTVDGTFTVVDEEKPVFTAPADTTLCRVSGAISANPTTTGEVAQTDVTDNCTASGDFTISWFDTDTTGTDADVRVITRKWVVKDLCDNADTVNQTITVKPSIQTSGNVTYTDPTPIEVTMKYGVCDTLIDVAFNWTNNMTGNVVVVDSTATPYMPTDHRFTAEHSPYTITWTLTDDCGDLIEVTQTITVNYPLCGGTFKTNADGDGIEYATLQVGCNCWMAENSRTTKYADGTDVTPAPMTYGTPVTTYGYLYNYYAATKTTPPTRSTRAAVADGQGICPDGWHIPDDEDFADLMSHYEAEDLMSTDHWLTPGTNTSGYGLEPAGMYNAELDRYEYLYVQTFLWSYEPGAVVYHACQFGSACGTIEVIPASAYNGFSVRCVRNTED